MSKTVLLTGVSGFLGSHALRHILINTDWNVVGIASFSHKGRASRIDEQLKGLERSRFRLVLHDLCNPITADIAKEIGDVDYVLHYASESHVDRSISNPRDFINNNIQVALTMSDYVRHFPVEKFIAVSTDEVYGPIGAADGGWKEGSPHRPSNPYSASKSAQEDIYFSYWRTYGIPVVITNCMNLIGELQDSEKFVPMVIKKVLDGKTVEIHATRSGIPGSRFYLHARNQADAHLFLLDRHDTTLYSEGVKDLDRFNIVGLTEMNNLDFAEKIAKLVGKPLVYDLVDVHSARPGHDRRYGLDGSKIASLGWTPPIPFDESLRRTVDWYMLNTAYLN